MKTLRTIFTLALLMLPLCLGAQSKAETKLYGKTIGKPSIKAADKFLKKYHNSVYAPKVISLKDSLLMVEFTKANVSLISKADAKAVAGSAIDAIGWKKDGVEHVLALDSDLSIRVLSPTGTLEEVRNTSVYTMSEAAPSVSLVTPMEMITPFGAKRLYVHFAYRNADSEYVEALYMPAEDIMNQALFYGTPMGDGRIEGDSPEMIEGLTLSAEMMYLVGRLKENPALVQISKADLLTDQSIQWWIQKNPKAQTSASKLVFGKLDPESSIVEACKKARKERGKSASAALFDVRGYTVICILSGGEYKLVWAEPVCQNKKKDAYIRSIFFENDGTTLDVIYYKGKTTFKKKISLISQSLRHLK